MKIDYKSMTKLIDIRIKQIDDASKENDYFNKEWRELSKIRKALTQLLLLERNTPDEYQLKLVESYNDFEKYESDDEPQ